MQKNYTGQKKQHVEFIGVSGVGKTTLFRKIISILPINSRSWRTPKEALKEVNSKIKNEYKVNMDVGNFKKIIHDTSLQNYDYLMRLRIEKQSFDNCLKAAKMISFYYERLMWEAAVFDYFNYHNFIVHHDGIIHNIGSISPDTNNNDLQEILTAYGVNAIVYCTLSADEAFSRRKKRIKDSKGTFIERDLSDHDLMTKCQNSVESARKKAETLRDAGIPIIEINMSREIPILDNAQKVISFLNDNLLTVEGFFSKDMKFINYNEFKRVIAQNKGGHWSTQPIHKRWDYHQKAIDIIKGLNIFSPENILEMGTMGAQLVKGSHTLDYMEKWDFIGKSPTYIHDARTFPWPVADKNYELFIALRVFQHLAPVQKEAFLEAKRIAKRLILAVPVKYSTQLKRVQSAGITQEQFVDWNDGVKPNLVIPTLMCPLYYWDFTTNR